MPHSLSFLRNRGKRNSTSLTPSPGSGPDSAVGMTSATQLVRDDNDDDAARIETTHASHSQPSSPVSSPEYEYEYEEEAEDEVEDPTLYYTKRSGESFDARTPRPRRHSATSSKLGGPAEHVTSSKSTHDNTLDIPLAVAIIPPLGTLLIGGNFAYDFLLLLLMFFYLHQVKSSSFITLVVLFHSHFSFSK